MARFRAASDVVRSLDGELTESLQASAAKAITSDQVQRRVHFRGMVLIVGSEREEPPTCARQEKWAGVLPISPGATRHCVVFIATIVY